MTVIVDDAGSGDLLFGVVVGAYREETKEFKSTYKNPAELSQKSLQASTLHQKKKFTFAKAASLTLQQKNYVKYTEKTELNE